MGSPRDTPVDLNGGASGSELINKAMASSSAFILAMVDRFRLPGGLPGFLFGPFFLVLFMLRLATFEVEFASKSLLTSVLTCVSPDKLGLSCVNLLESPSGLSDDDRSDVSFLVSETSSILPLLLVTISFPLFL